MVCPHNGTAVVKRLSVRARVWGRDGGAPEGGLIKGDRDDTCYYGEGGGGGYPFVACVGYI